MTLAPGSTIALFSDGLIEQRTASLDEGLERLRLALLEPSASFDAMCDRLMRLAGGTADDVTMLVARLAPPT